MEIWKMISKTRHKKFLDDVDSFFNDYESLVEDTIVEIGGDILDELFQRSPHINFSKRMLSVSHYDANHKVFINEDDPFSVNVMGGTFSLTASYNYILREKDVMSQFKLGDSFTFRNNTEHSTDVEEGWISQLRNTPGYKIYTNTAMNLHSHFEYCHGIDIVPSADFSFGGSSGNGAWFTLGEKLDQGKNDDWV